MQKRINPNNPKNSSLVQRLLEYKELGGSADITIAEFLRLSKVDPDIQKLIRNADATTDRKAYPDSQLTFHKGNRGLELGGYLTSEEMTMLKLVFEEGVDQGNLVQVSTREAQRITKLDIRTVRKCIAGLLAKGCIAIKLPGTRNSAAVYMVNPAIVTVGNSKANQRSFWELTGTVYKTSDKTVTEDTFSSPHESWIIMAKRCSYTVGPRAHGKPKDPEYLKFNGFHFLDKKTAPSSGNDEAALSDESESES